MPTSYEEALSEIFGGKPESYYPAKKTQLEAYKKTNIVKGDLARAMAPSIKPTKYDEVMDEINHESPPMVIADKKDIDISLRNENSYNKIMSEIGLDNEVGIRAKGTKQGDIWGTKFGKAGKVLLTALSADEHSIVWTINKALGKKPKRDFGDYTYTNLLKDMGAPNNMATEATGFAMSILLSPMTYLTFGTTGLAKIGFKGTALTVRGEKLVAQITKELSNEAISKKMVSLGRELTVAESNAIRQSTKFDVEQQVLKRFGEIHDETVNISEKILQAKESDLITRGGLRFEAPKILGGGILNIADLTFKNKTVLSGTEIASFIKQTRADKALRWLSKTEIGRGASEFGESILNLTKTGRKLFDTEIGVDKKMMDYLVRAGDKAEHVFEQLKKTIPEADLAKLEVSQIRAMHVQHEADLFKAMQKNSKFTDLLLKPLSSKQREEFSEIMLSASEESRRHGFARTINVKDYLKREDPVMQQVVDRWAGQGKFANRKSIMEKLADKSNALIGERLPIWFPGIIEKYAGRTRFKLNLKPEEAERAFLTPREGKHFDKYTRNADVAIVHRLNEISQANIQNKFFNKVVDLKLGDLQIAKTPQDVGKFLNEGYVEFRRPIDIALRQGDNLLKRHEEATYFVKPEFLKEFNRVVYTDRLKLGPLKDVFKIIEPTTQWFKRHVTVTHPAFLAGQMISNTVMNSLTIGLHAVNPKLWFQAARATLHNEKFTPKGTLDRAYKGVSDFIFHGKGRMETATGEIIDLSKVATEAFEAGATKSGQFQADILNLTSRDKTLSEMFAWNANTYFNPISPRFLPVAAMGKFNQAIENHARMVNYLVHRQRGLSPKMAAFETNRTLFDYDDITGFERLINNSLIPFYTFSKKNIAASAHILATKPALILNQFKIMRDLGPTDRELADMPPWARKKFIFKFNNMYFHNFRLPLEDIIQLASEDPIQRINPYLKFGFERYTGKDSFTKQNLDEANNANDFWWVGEILQSKAPSPFKWAARLIRDTIDLERVERSDGTYKWVGDPDILHVLRNSPSARYGSVMAQWQKDKKGIDLTMRALLGIIRIERNQELIHHIEKAEFKEKAKGLASEYKFLNKWDGLKPIAYGGNDFEIKAWRLLMKDIDESMDRKEKEYLLKEFKDEIEIEEKSRIMEIGGR